MSLRWYARLALVLAAILSSATFINAALTNDPLTNAEQTPGHASLAGRLLVASPALGDPNFARTVILLVKHDQNGALGIVINRPLGERPIAQVLNVLGEKVAGMEGTVRIFEGGPVQREVGFVVHSADYRRANTLDIGGRVGVTPSPDVLRDIGNGRGPEKHFVAFGYAGWTAGQLEGEMKLEAWFTAPADPKLIFDDDRNKVWENALARRQRDL